MSTRGSVKGMKDVLGTLKALGEDIKGGGGSSGGTDTNEAMQDWRVEGIGGVGCKGSDGIPMASGWILAGDDIIITASGVEGKVVYVDGPAAADLEMGGYKHTIGVKLAISGQIRQYSPSQVVFNPSKRPTFLHTTDPILVKRWEDMLKTALVHGVNHDVLAMEEYINASFVVKESKESLEDAAAAAADGTATVSTNKEDGSGSPKSVMQYDDGRTLLPFGSGLIAAPEDVKKYPSLIPLDRLEERVRTVVYEAEKPRVSLYTLLFALLHATQLDIDLTKYIYVFALSYPISGYSHHVRRCQTVRIATRRNESTQGQGDAIAQSSRTSKAFTQPE